MNAENLKEYIESNSESEQEALETTAKALNQLKSEFRASKSWEEYKELVQRSEGVTL